MKPESYYTAEGDIAYIRVRAPQGQISSEEKPWGLLDFDETGELIGIEVWSASKLLSPEVVDALPLLEETTPAATGPPPQAA